MFIVSESRSPPAPFGGAELNLADTIQEPSRPSERRRAFIVLLSIDISTLRGEEPPNGAGEIRRFRSINISLLRSEVRIP